MPMLGDAVTDPIPLDLPDVADDPDVLTRTADALGWALRQRLAPPDPDGDPTSRFNNYL